VRKGGKHTLIDIVKELTSASSRDREFKRKRERGGHREAKKRTRDG